MHVSVGTLDLFTWDAQKEIFDGTILGDSHLAFLFRQVKVCRLQAMLQEAAGAVRAHSDTGLGDC